MCSADASCPSVLQSQKTAGKLWRDRGLNWKEFLPEDQDVNKFVTEQVGALQTWAVWGTLGRVLLLGAWCSPVLPLTACLCLFTQKLEYTLGDSSDTPSRKELTSEELYKQMDELLKENPNNQRIYDWIEVREWAQHPWVWGLSPGSLPYLTTLLSSLLQANLSEQQVSSNTFIRALMTSVCHSAIICQYQGEVGGGIILCMLPPSHAPSPRS